MYVHFHHFIDESITNSLQLACFSTCDLSNSNNNVQDMLDQFTGDLNSCCNSVSTTSGYGVRERGTTPCTTLCKFCCNHISLQLLT